MKPNLFISQNSWLRNSDLLIIIIFCCVPLFMSFPYRVNIFLSWEGAYRLYLGQVPYRDFGLPMGFGYWVVPAIFFKIFGPYLISLIKAQVFLNFICCLSFRGILQKLKLPDGIRIAVLIVFCLSYILPNFWPWYNNSVIIWQLVGLNFLLSFLDNTAAKRYLFLLMSCFFLFVSFFTKQDGGFLGFAIAGALVLYNTIVTKKWKDFLLFLVFYGVIAAMVILPFTKYSFGYWFNYGQPPHTARISIADILGELFGASQWIKFYLLLIALLVAYKIKVNRKFLTNRQEMIFLLLTLGILAEALIFGVTSYTPPDNNIFFHSFALAYIITGLSGITAINFNRLYYFLGLTVCILFWWSAGYWQYINRIIARMLPVETADTRKDSLPAENVINRYTYMLNLDSNYYEDESTWQTVDGLRSFQNIYLPPSTIAGIQRLKKMPVLTTKEAAVLNMTELTPLDYEFGYKLETGQDHPLWDHLGVCMFNKQCDDYCNKIKNKQYDVVLFEYVPSLNNFFPFRIRDSLQVYYKKTDSFLAPRRPTNGTIEVYVK